MEKDNKQNKKLIGRSANEWSEQLWDALINKISNLKDRQEIKGILEKLVSEDEKKMILKRLAVIALLRSGKSYREIGEILWLSPNTVSTIKKNMIGGSKHYKSYLAFYGGPTKWSGPIKTPTPFLEEIFKEVDIWELLTNPHALAALD